MTFRRLHGFGPVTAAAVMFTLGFATAAVARPDGPPSHRPPGPDLLVFELDLDAETEAAIERLFEENREEQSARHQELRDARHNLGELLDGEEVDATEIFAQVDQIAALALEARKHGMRTMLDVRALLTPEQRLELKQLREERRPRRRPAPPF
ncbi:periplasmic heavy metal sensor [Myxococcota bacterium]|nr:periplasmic heavy metal sensor [Myxococcota bacterium]